MNLTPPPREQRRGTRTADRDLAPTAPRQTADHGTDESARAERAEQDHPVPPSVTRKGEAVEIVHDFPHAHGSHRSDAQVTFVWDEGWAVHQRAAATHQDLVPGLAREHPLLPDGAAEPAACVTGGQAGTGMPELQREVPAARGLLPGPGRCADAPVR
ncbi:hypothetical protein ACFY1P_34055 [Streptomyces sp. NPDC001407]|uniref:hypothetical protein n=1 Tax=Streptomyces sp. NPDC001407 TaxID=3364573 RepID=UPI0036765B9F